MTKELIAVLDGQITGRVARDQRGRLSLTYDEVWREADNAYPLSVSMPLALAQHGHARIDPFLWGLLPDNQMILDQWARKFHVSGRNAFSLISAVGEDCAGAVQFVPPERFENVLGAARPEIEWLDEGAIAQRLRALREDISAWRVPRDTGQFSLAPPPQAAPISPPWPRALRTTATSPTAGAARASSLSTPTGMRANSARSTLP